MLSGKLGQFIVAIIVMLILMGLTAQHMLKKTDNASWQKLSAEGLNLKIQTGLTQMYWQWQKQGRSRHIEYKPENEKQGYVVVMTAKGKPEVTKNKEGCQEFLRWFIEKKALSNQLEVSTTFIETKVIDETLSKALKGHTETVYICQFLYANTVLQYDLITGLFTITD